VVVIQQSLASSSLSAGAWRHQNRLISPGDNCLYCLPRLLLYPHSRSLASSTRRHLAAAAPLPTGYRGRLNIYAAGPTFYLAPRLLSLHSRGPTPTTLLCLLLPLPATSACLPHSVPHLYYHHPHHATQATPWLHGPYWASLLQHYHVTHCACKHSLISSAADCASCSLWAVTCAWV